MDARSQLTEALAALADKLGVAPLATGEDQVSILSFDEVDILITSDEQSLTVFARLGTAPQNDSDLLEALLAANLFWQETGGATLSIEPYSRGIIMAQKVAAAEVFSVDSLEAAIENFARYAIEWSRTIDRLASGAAEASVALPEAVLTNRA